MKIGSLETEGAVFLAPMVGITDTPFRRLVQSFGVSALWTEMISADGLAASKAVFRTMRLDGHTVPTIFQLIGKRAETMAVAAHKIADQGEAAAIDLNMGCPARRVVGKGSGAALMKDLPLAAAIIHAVRKAMSLPLTVKMRSGWDEHTKTGVELAHIAEAEGADALVIHSRSRSKAHSGPVDLDALAEVTRSVTIPVIGNGGVNTVDDAVTMLRHSGCAGIMVGRGALGRPWFLGELMRRLGDSDEPSRAPVTYADVIEQHFIHHTNWWGERSATLKMRKHLAWYSRSFPEGAAFRRAVFRMDDQAEVRSHVRDFFGQVTIDEVQLVTENRPINHEG